MPHFKRNYYIFTNNFVVATAKAHSRRLAQQISRRHSQILFREAAHFGFSTPQSVHRAASITIFVTQCVFLKFRRKRNEKKKQYITAKNLCAQNFKRRRIRMRLQLSAHTCLLQITCLSHHSLIRRPHSVAEYFSSSMRLCEHTAKEARKYFVYFFSSSVLFSYG